MFQEGLDLGLQIRSVDNMKTTAMFVLLLAVFSSFQLITADESKNASQPHIIFILADDLVSILQTHECKINSKQL